MKCPACGTNCSAAEPACPVCNASLVSSSDLEQQPRPKKKRKKRKRKKKESILAHIDFGDIAKLSLVPVVLIGFFWLYIIIVSPLFENKMYPLNSEQQAVVRHVESLGGSVDFEVTDDGLILVSGSRTVGRNGRIVADNTTKNVIGYYAYVTIDLSGTAATDEDVERVAPVFRNLTGKKLKSHHLDALILRNTKITDRTLEAISVAVRRIDVTGTKVTTGCAAKFAKRFPIGTTEIIGP